MWGTSRRIVRYLIIVLCLVLTSCCGVQATQVFRPRVQAGLADSVGRSYCPTEKIAFTQETGCLNDGSFEFCVPIKTLEAMAQVKEIVPQAECGPHRGRAGCNTETELLCMVPVDRLCVTYHGALNDAGWQIVCDLAALPQIRAIVPTWYE